MLSVLHVRPLFQTCERWVFSPVCLGRGNYSLLVPEVKRNRGVYCIREDDHLDTTKSGYAVLEAMLAVAICLML